jgi:hypothetical protein
MSNSKPIKNYYKDMFGETEEGEFSMDDPPTDDIQQVSEEEKMPYLLLRISRMKFKKRRFLNGAQQGLGFGRFFS